MASLILENWVFSSVFLFSILTVSVFLGCVNTGDYHDDYQKEIDRPLCEKRHDPEECYQNYVKYQEHKRKGRCYVKESFQVGTSNENNVILVDVYILNIEKLSDKQIENSFNEINSVWEDYGARFKINSIRRINNKNLKMTVYQESNDDEVLFFLESVTGGRITPRDDKILDVILIEKCGIKCRLGQLIKQEKMNYKGQGGTLKDGTKFVQLRYNSENNTWIFSHEIAHLLNLEDIPGFTGEYNLMTHLGCIKTEYYPTVLNQEQVDRAVHASRYFQNST
jgi:hypothetical protein